MLNTGQIPTLERFKSFCTVPIKTCSNKTDVWPECLVLSCLAAIKIVQQHLISAESHPKTKMTENFSLTKENRGRSLHLGEC